MNVWGFWSQVVGALLVLLGLGWTWVWWSPRALAERFRDGWARLAARRRRAWARLRGKPLELSGVVASGSITLSGSATVTAMGHIRPSDASTDLLAWVAYLEGRIVEAERQTAVLRRQSAEGLDAVRGELTRGLSDSQVRVDRQAEAHRDALRRANLSGLFLAACGGLLTFVGLIMAGPPT